MRKLSLVVIVTILAGASAVYMATKTTKVKVAPPPVVSAPTSAPLPRTFEELRADATAKIGQQKKTVAGNTVKVDLSPLAGRKLGGLYAKYLGIQPGIVPSSVEVSFGERMATMYHQKVNYTLCRKDKMGNLLPCKVASDTVLSQAPDLLARYIGSDKMPMNLPEFFSIADKKVSTAKKSIDWNALCKDSEYRLDTEKCKLLQALAANLSGRDIVAYGMTELLPSSEGDLNVRYMDVLLRNAGAQFLYYVPSLGDRYASLGVYQFTFLALREDEEATEGVSRVNVHVKETGEKLPGSVVKLSGHQHHTAAFYFAVNNLAHALKKLDKRQVAILSSIHKNRQDEVVVLVACAHHNPKNTFPVVKRWLDEEIKYSNAEKKGKEKKGAKKKKTPLSPPDFVRMFPKVADLHQYAVKSKNNLLAVYAVK